MRTDERQGEPPIKRPRAGGPSRDAERSREAILDAADAVFARCGYAASSLHEIAAAAGCSRATPAYFFSSKRQLHVAVLQRALTERDQSTRAALTKVDEWIATGAAIEELRPAVASAVRGYLEFLDQRPTFAQLIAWEGVSGAENLEAVDKHTSAMTATFTALREVAPDRGLRLFEVDEVVLALVSLTFSPYTQRSTFMRALGWDFDDDASRQRHEQLVVELVMTLLIKPHDNRHDRPATATQ